MKKAALILLVMLPAVAAVSSTKENDPRYKYYSCVKQAAIKYAKSTEPAETAAIAAIESCIPEENDAVKAAGPDLSSAQQRNIRALFREQTQPFAIKIIMDERLK